MDGGLQMQPDKEDGAGIQDRVESRQVVCGVMLHWKRQDVSHVNILATIKVSKVYNTAC